MVTTEGTPLLGGDGSGDGSGAMRTAPALSSSKTRSKEILKQAAQRSGDAEETARLSEVIAEMDKDESHSHLWLAFALFSIVNHFLGGVFTFHLLEGMSLLDAAYFVVCTVTTVGYGDIAPTRWVSKIYACYFVFCSVSMISTMLAYSVGILIDKQEELLLHSIVGATDASDTESGVSYDSPSTPAQSAPAAADASLPNRPILAPVADMLRSIPFVSRFTDFSFLEDLSWLGDYNEVAATAFIFFLVLAFGVWVFMYLEELSWVDAIYVVSVSSTTVGFGDIEPTRDVTKAIMTVWLLISTLTLAKLITDQSDAYVRSRQRAVTRRLLSARMDLASLRRMDSEGDGRVDRAEFLETMLEQTGKVSRADLDECLQRFKELDKDGSGRIDPNDIAR